MQNYTDTIISQYAQSPSINRLIDNFNLYIDPQNDINNFIANIWDIQTANTQGLDIWGRIVGVSRILQVPSNEDAFGFNQAGTDGTTPFNEAVFYVTGMGQYQTLSMLDEPYRKLIMLKAFSNIARSTAPTLNYILTQLFGGQIRKESFVEGSALDGGIVLDQTPLEEYLETITTNGNRCYVAEYGKMNIGLVFEFILEPWEYAMLSQTGILPIPAGVSVNIYQLPDGQIFGFSQDYATGFNEGTFNVESIIYAN